MRESTRRRLEEQAVLAKRQRMSVAILGGIAVFLLLGMFACSAACSHPAQASDGTVLQSSSESTTSVSTEKPFIRAEGNEWSDDAGVVHGSTQDGITYVVYGQGVESNSTDKVSFAAVGDALGTDNSMPLADAYATTIGDGRYDFNPFYQEIGPAMQKYDVRFINQETAMAGTHNGLTLSGYPVFNSPDAMAKAENDQGFNVVNFGSNHSWDMGAEGIERTQHIFAGYPEMMLVGSYPTQDDRDAVHMIERNGMRIAFVSYCYGANAYQDTSTLPNTYYMCPFDKDQMASDIARAKQVADAVVVYMHWGTEYTVKPDNQQVEYAKFLADQDVDLVIGSHAHIMQPVKYVEGSTGNTIPVVYGLGDFLSGWTLTDTILSGMFTCDFAWRDGDVAVENPQWHPLIEWSQGQEVFIRQLSGMNNAEIDANTRTEDVTDDSSYIPDMIESSGMDVPVIM